MLDEHFVDYLAGPIRLIADMVLTHALSSVERHWNGELNASNYAPGRFSSAL